MRLVGTSRDELFGQLFGALEKVRYFRNTPDGDDDPAQLEKATRIFHDAVNVGLISLLTSLKVYFFYW